MIIRGGENIYSVEVEAALFEHPAVADCAVIGIPDPILGEEVGAVVVLRPGTQGGRRGARRACPPAAGRLHGARPISGSGTSPLPRNPAGKVLKRELRRSCGNEFPRSARRSPGAGRCRPGGPARHNERRPRRATAVRTSRLG